MKRYVQSIHSDKAPLFEVLNEYPNHWYMSIDCVGVTFLKSEYHEVPAPERWERCGKDQISLSGSDTRALRLNNAYPSLNIYVPSGYRWAWDKQKDGTLVIERKVGE